MDYTAKDLGSIAGVITVTMYLMMFVKPLAANAARLKNLPTWLFTAALSLLLTVLAHFAFHTLSGSIPELLFNAFLAALGAAGTRNIGQNLITPVKESHDSTDDDSDDPDDDVPPSAPALSLSPLRIPTLTAIAALFVLSAVGCSTSQPFSVAVKASAPILADRTDTYISKDTSLDEDTKRLHHAWVNDFRVATSQPTFENVYDSWTPTRNMLVDYTNHDTVLATQPSRIPLRQRIISGFDDLIESERVRRLIWFPFSTPMTPLPRKPFAPTTQPYQTLQR